MTVPGRVGGGERRYLAIPITADHILGAGVARRVGPASSSEADGRFPVLYDIDAALDSQIQQVMKKDFEADEDWEDEV